jgi:hypothetical protein
VLEGGEPKVVIHVGASDSAFTEVLDGTLQPGAEVITDSKTAE